MKILTALSISLALLLSGCAVVKQSATSTTRNLDGSVTTMVATSSIISTGDSKTIVDKVRASAGKTMSVGATGVQEETSSAAIQALGQLFMAGLQGYLKAVPVGPLPAVPAHQP